LKQTIDSLLFFKFWRNEARDYKQRFIGHCNTKTDIKEANFFGQNGEYIVAGYNSLINVKLKAVNFLLFLRSDDGNFYIWERKTCRLKSVYKADKAIVNCVQPHPYLPLIATSGIDHEIGLWSPQSIVSFLFPPCCAYCIFVIYNNLGI
jgi:WD and tetratricopeptide repeats protein 1